MRRVLTALALLLTASSAAAQVVTSPELVTPTTAYTLAWDHAGTALDHFEVRFAASGTWTNVAKAQVLVVPVLAVGSHTAQVRACAAKLPTTATCPMAALAFTVTAPKPVPRLSPCPDGSAGRPVTIILNATAVLATLCEG